MDSEPVSESQLPSPLLPSVRSTGMGSAALKPFLPPAGSAALKPPLAPALSSRPSSHAPVNHKQTAQPAAQGTTQQSVSTIGRHQSAAPPDADSPHQSLRAKPQHAPKGRLELPQAPKRHLGLHASPGPRPESSPKSEEHVPPQQPIAQADFAFLAQSPDRLKPEQPAPITSPFKKVLSPWEKERQNQASPSAAPQTNSQHLLGYPIRSRGSQSAAAHYCTG